MNLQNVSFIALLAAVSLAFVGLLSDFLQPIFWAATLAVLFYPVYTPLLDLTRGRRGLAAGLTLIVICCTVLAPAWFMVSSVISEAALLFVRINSGEINIGATINWLQSSLPAVNTFFDSIGITSEEINRNLTSAAIKSSQFIGTLTLQAGQNAVRFGAMFFLMLYVLFYFLREGDELLNQIVHALPLGDVRERALFNKFAEVSRATIKGTLVIGMIQGALGGMMFWFLGIEGAVFWGTIMAILSLVPIVGASLVWGPAAIIMVANAEFFKATILVAVGVLLIGLVDNLLRPILVGRDTRMPDYLVLLSTLGGLTVFGMSGFIIGPVIAALFLTLWVMFRDEFGRSDLGNESE
jgi:predicted PurR-regulated permease PerM